MTPQSHHPGVASIDPATSPSGLPRRAPRRASWKWWVCASAGVHLLVGMVLVLWLSEPPAESALVTCTQCAFVEPEAALEALDDDVAELEPVEIEAHEPLPEVESVELPEEAVLPDELPALDRLPATPSLQVSSRMFKRRTPRVPPPTVSLPVARPPTAVVVPVAAPVPVTQPRTKRGGSRLKSRFIPKPERYYPPEARRRGIQGTVIVVVTVDAKGSVIDVKISRSSGSRLLDDAAIRLMFDARFTPPGFEQKAKAPVNFILQ